MLQAREQPGYTRQLTRPPREGSGRRRSAVPRQSAAAVEETGEHAARLAWPTKLFLVSLFIPWLVTLGGTTFTVSRLVLLVLAVPLLIKWIKLAATSFKATDGLLIGYVGWAALCLFFAHGADEAMRSAGLLFAETLPPYMLARVYIRSLADLRAVLKFLFYALCALAAFAVYESITGKNMVGNVFAMVLPTFPLETLEMRAGIWRAQSVFEHSIHLGVFAASLLPFLLLLPQGKSMMMRVAGPAASLLATFLSLSSGPIAVAAAQIVLVAWDRIARRNPYRWTIVLLGLAAIYVVLALASKRSVVEIYITYFTFSQQSSWYRMAIWTYTSASVATHPWFGIGFADWARPNWMYSTIDIYWMVQAVRYGLPGAALLILAYLASIIDAVRARTFDPDIQLARTAYVVSMVGFFIGGLTVHFWGAIGVYFMFMLGAGSWMSDASRETVRIPRRTATAGGA